MNNTIEWQGASLKVKVSKKAKSIRLQVQQGEFSLILPMRVGSSDIQCFLAGATAWISKQMRQSANKITETVVFWPDILAVEVPFPFQGTTILLSVQNPSAIRSFMEQEALRLASSWAQDYALLLGLAPRSITIKQTKSRWGSLGIHNDMFLNWVLIFAPPHVFRYVVLHEMGHLRYRSHGPRFWKLVEQYMPDYREARRWLRCFGSQLTPPPHLGFS